MEILARRRALGLERQSLARLTGIPYHTIGRLDRDERAARPAELQRIDLVLRLFERAAAEARAALATTKAA